MYVEVLATLSPQVRRGERFTLRSVPPARRGLASGTTSLH